ncbi:MAG: hypothetical protein ACK417_09835 [Bacteroidia bacterium]
MLSLRYLLLVLALFLPALLNAQSRQLSVYKPNGTLAQRFYEGDMISLQWKQEQWIRGVLDKLYVDSLVLDGLPISLQDISAVRVMKSALLTPALNLGIAGVLYPGIVIINGLTSDSRPLLTTRAAWSSVLLLGAAGALTYAGGLRTYHTTEPGRLRITDFNFNALGEQTP